MSVRGSRAFTWSPIALNKPKRILVRGRHVAVPDVDYLGQPLADFAKTLRQQDPYDRIRFTPPPSVRSGVGLSGDYQMDGYIVSPLPKLELPSAHGFSRPSTSDVMKPYHLWILTITV